jgi:DNA polymerase-3 subunit delta
VACFPDEARDLEAVIREVFAGSKVQISPEAKRLLMLRLGADRALSRAEIDKLALYALGKAVIEESDVEAAVGDAAELALDRIVMAAAAGRAATALAECDRSVASGESPQGVIAALQRHFLRLHRMRGALDNGRSMDDVLRSLRPPPHFKQRDALEQQGRSWSTRKLNTALARIAEAAKAARLNSALEGTLTESLLLDLGVLARDGKS